MQKDLVTVIIPCYNHEQYIKECLNSILAENYTNKEIIIIDDGSKDKSVEKINEFINETKTDVPIKLYVQENCGVVKTLNKLISLAQGEFIAIVASDDKLSNNGIEKRVAYLKENPQKLAVIGNACCIDSSGNIIASNAAKDLYNANLKHLNNPKKLYKELVLSWCVVGPCLLIKKNTYNLVGLYSEDYLIEDRDFYLKLIEKKVLGYIPDIVSQYRIHTTNFSKAQQSSKRTILECAKINVAHSSNSYSWAEKLFLKSYKIDCYFLQKNNKIIYKVFRIIRRVFVGLVNIF